MSVLLLAVIGASAVRPIATSHRARQVGYALVLVPLPSAVAVHLLLLHAGRLDQLLFVNALVAFGAGAILVLGRDERSDGGGVGDDPEPHWWPDFERELREYTSRENRPRRRLVRS
jgi:hypothetical protein